MRTRSLKIQFKLWWPLIRPIFRAYAKVHILPKILKKNQNSLQFINLDNQINWKYHLLMIKGVVTSNVNEF